MTARHTPGPWHMAPSGICAPNGRALICADDIAGEDDDECIGNARLIASAPEMLQALQRLTHPSGADDDDVAFALEVIARATEMPL